LRQGLFGLQRVVDDNDVGTASGEHATDRGGKPAALRGGLEPKFLREPVADAIGGTGDDSPAISRNRSPCSETS
jgi:hypothetical protein